MELRAEERRAACYCSAGNDIIAGVKQPLFTLIYNPPLPSSSSHGGVRPAAGEGREQKEQGWESQSKIMEINLTVKNKA